MKPRNIVAIATAGLALAPLVLFAEIRTWTNTDGQTMEARITDVDGDHVVFERDGRTYNYPIANLSETNQQDIQEWARENEEKLREREAQQRVPNALNGNLVELTGSRLRDYSDDNLEGKRLFAFYYSASWCGPCRRFTPELVDFYRDVRRQHPEFEVILVSSDRDAQSMRDYMREYRMEWPALDFDQRRGLDVVNQGRGRGIPNLVFMDSSGEILSQSYVDGNYVGPGRVLRDIQNHLRNNRS